MLWAMLFSSAVSNTGGHNVLEPAAHAKPILVGPSMQNFKDSYALLSKVKACKMVNNNDELTKEMLDILANDERREQMQGVFAGYQGKPRRRRAQYPLSQGAA